jgi:DNA-directed RNA polymerase specialized sigma24 family protein
MSGIAENRLRNLARRQSSGFDVPAGIENGADLEDPAPWPGREGPPEGQEDEWRLLLRGLDQIKPKNREVLQLRNFERLSFRDIGLRMRRSEEAVWMMHKRAKAELIGVIHGLRAARGD